MATYRRCTRGANVTAIHKQLCHLAVINASNVYPFAQGRCCIRGTANLGAWIARTTSTISCNPIFAANVSQYAITVGVYGAGPALNQRLRAIPIPISGGLLGLRVGWTHSESLARLSAVQNLADLRRVTLLQGQGWSELALFDHSGLRTYAAPPQYLFRLVAEQRVELFPQGIGDLQVQQPTATKWSDTIEIEPRLLIAYPFAGFFYVNPDNDALAEAIALGFERAIADGSYQALLERRVMTPWLKQNLRLRQRQVIFVPNPNVGDGLEDVEPRHWLVPWQGLASGQIKTGEQLCGQSGFKPLCD